MNRQGKNGIPYCDYTWNVVTGCLHGCEYCFARTIAERFTPKGPSSEDCIQPGNGLHEIRLKCRQPFKYGFQPTLHPYRAREPLSVELNKAVIHDRREKGWNTKDLNRPLMIFVSDMGDLFGQWVPSEWIRRVLKTVTECPQHTFLFLTKNPKRYLEFTFPKNAWLGTSIENQRAADQRVPLLNLVTASRKFLSMEPLQGPVNLARLLSTQTPTYFCTRCGERQFVDRYQVENKRCSNCRGTIDWSQAKPGSSFDWIILGGQSGKNAKPMYPGWVRTTQQQCQAAGISFYFKQWGEWTTEYPQNLSLSNRAITYQFGNQFYHVGKKAAGRVLDGRTWDEIPIAYTGTKA